MSAPLNPAPPQAVPPRSFAVNLAAMMGICLAFMLTALNTSVVGTAMPRIVADLQGYDLYPWAASSYLVGNTVLIPLAGRLGDLYGRKPFLLVAVALFALASLACGLSQSMVQLILARGVQGLAGGIFLGVASASVADLFPQSAERLRWQVYMSAAYGLAMAVGPSFGGWVSEQASWRYVFHANLPVALAAFAMANSPGHVGHVEINGVAEQARVLRAYHAASGLECREMLLGSGGGERAQLACGDQLAQPLLRGSGRR